MLEKGYHAVGLQEILSETGVPKGSFYHYFKSKEDYGVTVIETYADGHARRAQELLADSDRSPKERLWTFFQNCRELHSTSGCRRGCLIAKLGMEVSDLSNSMRAALKRGSDQCKAQFTRCIREGQEIGEFNDSHDPEDLAEFLHNAWEGTMLRMQIDQDLKPVDNFITLVFKRLLA